MVLKHSLAAIFITLIWLSLVALAGTAPMDTERSVEELKLMTTPELAGEARRTCHSVLISLESAERYSAIGQKYRDAGSYRKGEEQSKRAYRERQYLQRIGLVLRDRLHGEMPTWFEQFGRAIDSKNKPECDAAAAAGWRPKQ